jgi:UDP-N-acetylmuramate--alanine ligase
MKHAIKSIHFVGIGGAGMSGIAEVLHNQGYIVSGSDKMLSNTTQRLQNLGLNIVFGHHADHVLNVDCVVTSTAVTADNPEVLQAKAQRIPVVPRAVMLAELMRAFKGIAIAGTHGKTTTTSLAASVFAACGKDPTFVIGGKLNSVGANAQLGKGEYIVVEADESDASFLKLLPVMAIITNIDQDHMDTYEHSYDKLKQAFVDFLHKMPFYGTAIVCIDDAGVQAILDKIQRPIISYGLSDLADIRAIDVRAVGATMHFTVKRKDSIDLPIVLNCAGLHNVRNALSVIALATELEFDDLGIQTALQEFTGVGRRFQRYGTHKIPQQFVYNNTNNNNSNINNNINNNISDNISDNINNINEDNNKQLKDCDATFELIDDYGHHPVEMAATLSAVRGAFPNRRLVLAFQPHRYSRTRDCFEDFVRICSTADVLLLTEVYAAGETPIVAADGRALTRAIRVAGFIEPQFVESIHDLPHIILNTVQSGDVVICMGAGSIGASCSETVQQLQVLNAKNNKIASPYSTH